MTAFMTAYPTQQQSNTTSNTTTTNRESIQPPMSSTMSSKTPIQPTIQSAIQPPIQSVTSTTAAPASQFIQSASQTYHSTHQVCNQLRLTEPDLMELVETLSLHPGVDRQTGKFLFLTRDVDILKKALEMKFQGRSITDIAQLAKQPDFLQLSGGLPLPKIPPQPISSQPIPVGITVPNNSAQPINIAAMQTAINQSAGIATNNNAIASPIAQSNIVVKKPTYKLPEHLGFLNETLGQVQEAMIVNISELLDEKLSGLDEVIVELIRCKSENDGLKREVQTLRHDNARLQSELLKFKPLQFGLYHKV